MVVVTCGEGAVVCPGAGGSRRRARPHVLLPLQVRPAGRPADDGRGLQALGHARGLRHEPGRRRPADRDDGVHGRAARTSSRRSRATSGSAASCRQHAAALRDRPRPRDQDLPADRLHRLEPVRRHRRRPRADPGPRLVPGGEGHRARPPDRRAPGQVRDARPHRHLRDARQGLARRGVEGRDRRAASSSRSSCSSSTASSASSRSPGSRSTRRSCTRRSSSSTSRSRCRASPASC